MTDEPEKFTLNQAIALMRVYHVVEILISNDNTELIIICYGKLD